MSGHSKWATIKRQKGAADAARGQLFTKLSNAITIAVRQGAGPDPESNFKLRLAVDRARSANMPKENIERAIERATGAGGGSVEELLYEGFAPGGVAVIVEAVTDNKQRTVSEIKNIFDKNGGVLGSSGSVSYLFSRKGEIVARKNGRTSDEMLSSGINAGATDMEETELDVTYYVEPQDLQSVKKTLEEGGAAIDSATLAYVPISRVEADENTQEKIFQLLSKLEESDDVQEVYTNLA